MASKVANINNILSSDLEKDKKTEKLVGYFLELLSSKVQVDIEQFLAHGSFSYLVLLTSFLKSQ